jgi:hypothetical protein
MVKQIKIFMSIALSASLAGALLCACDGSSSQGQAPRPESQGRMRAIDERLRAEYGFSVLEPSPEAQKYAIGRLERGRAVAARDLVRQYIDCGHAALGQYGATAAIAEDVRRAEKAQSYLDEYIGDEALAESPPRSDGSAHRDDRRGGGEGGKDREAREADRNPERRRGN